MGLLYGDYGGRSDEFQPGGASYECGTYEQFKEATETAPPVMQISKGAIAVMFESSRPFTITEYAWKSDKLHEHEPKMWDDLIDNFSQHADEVKALLEKKKTTVSNGT
ncbi:hypothetical protein MMC08_008993 [Hypocenomyce scalaris]|nr:hypothetical protein [Hypocenomyce scalaris]